MTTAYVEERKPPTVPTCARATVELFFDGAHLSATGVREALRFPAVSGKPDETGKFNYSIDRQKLKGRGPIPEGKYWIQPSQTWENNWLKSMVVAPRAAWGNYRITIHPFPETNTYGRGGFFIHGGTVPGSAGCIDLTAQIDRFIDALKRELNGLPECYIHLTVRYPAPR
ncbi:tlde1 domain-containing protein [Nitrogeniibacter aestuarii]|uniref:tlde1 domain-containing protein n=1 Tax=Nitrogeniibacter aestuarii TaxID=2815343 RepID=UPI001D114515|nr:tlde1 domain-containing protein [Nitrogeniibacter aestuarii]